MKKIIISIILSISFFSCKKGNVQAFNNSKNLDSLIYVANKAKDSKSKLILADNVLNQIKPNLSDSICRSRYLSLAQIYSSLNNDKYVKICELLISNPSDPTNNYEKGYANFLLGYYYYNNANYEKSYLHLFNAERSFLKTNNYEYIGNIINSRADILTFKKDFVGAEKLSIKALKIAKENKNFNLMYVCYITLGNALSGINNTQKALEYYQKAIEISIKLSKQEYYKTYEAQPYNYIAHVYRKENNFKEAIKYANQGLSFDNFKQTDPSMYCYLTNNIAYSKFKLGDKNSLNQFKETLKIGDSIKSIPIQVTSKTYLGEYFLKHKDTLKANSFFKDAKILANKNNIFEDELKILQLLVLSDKEKSAFYSNRYIVLNDSLQNVERATRDKFARIEFETDEISTESEVVKKENNLLLTRIWIITGFAILSVLVLVLWFMNKSQKAKTRELLFKQEQQKANEEIYQLMIDQQQKIEEGKQIEKRRISQELHDGVMGRLSSIRLNLYVLNKRTDEETIQKCLEYIKDIQGIEKEIRTIAHDLNKNLFSDNVNFNGIVENLFTAIKSHSDIEFVLISDERIDWETVNNTVKINVFRIIQEALQNIDKYANATKVSITMSKINLAINIEIKDDGVGFETKRTKSGIGLKNMEKRMEDIGGKFTIESAPKSGTEINLTIPN